MSKKIISLGGGTPCFENNLKIIDETQNSISIYLKASIETLSERLKGGKNKRPLISHITSDIELNEFISKHLFERSFYYEKAEFKVLTDNLDVSEIINLIKSKLI